MQLTSEASVPNPVKPVSSDYVTDNSSQLVEDPGEEVGMVSEERQDELAGLFSGMAVSGEKSPRPSRPTQPVQPVRRVKPSPPTARMKKQRSEEQSAFGDLLGLVRENKNTFNGSLYTHKNYFNELLARLLILTRIWGNPQYQFPFYHPPFLYDHYDNLRFHFSIPVI